MVEQSPDAARRTSALNAAATYAGYAPSIHNTQPWRWRLRSDVLELWVDDARRLRATDPAGRMSALSCGAALHHAEVALRAAGWAATVSRLPDPDRAGLLATLTDLRAHRTTEDDDTQLGALKIRRTDRRPVPDTPVPAAALTAVAAAVGAHGAHLQLLSHEQVLDLAAAASHAAAAQAEDPAVRAELLRWTGQEQPVGAGVPAGVRPAAAPQTTVPGREFGAPGTLPIGGGHDTAARYGLLYGDGDEPRDWLRAGEALSAGWLCAVRHRLSLVPLSWVAEVPTTRALLAESSGRRGQPYLALRLGVAHPDAAGPEFTPRLPTRQVIERLDRADG
ncbi:MAG TPA: nitroreductase [Pilimelia sp.]|nr:nitroreductase [Pilimelia sp.]